MPMYIVFHAIILHRAMTTIIRLYLFAPGREGAEHGLHQAFKAVAFVGLGVGLLAVAVDDLFEVVHSVVAFWCGSVPNSHGVNKGYSGHIKKKRGTKLLLIPPIRLWYAFFPRISNARAHAVAYIATHHVGAIMPHSVCHNTNTWTLVIALPCGKS